MLNFAQKFVGRGGIPSTMTAKEPPAAGVDPSSLAADTKDGRVEVEEDSSGSITRGKLPAKPVLETNLQKQPKQIKTTHINLQGVPAWA